MESFYWLIALAVLLVIEILTLGLTTVWFAGGALVAFFVSLTGTNVFVQLIVFFAVSIALLYFTRPVAMKYFNQNRAKTNYEGLIGKEGIVTELIDNYKQTGTVNLNGQDWTARSEEDGYIINPDTQVRIVDIKGVKLIVTDKKEEL